LKIVFIVPDYPPIIGGAETFAGVVAERLAQRHQVWVVTRSPSAIARKINGLGESPLPAGEIRNGVTIYRVRYVEIPDLRMLTAVPGLLAKSLSVVGQVKPDVVHTVAFYPTLTIGRIVRSLFPVALVHTEQGLITDVLRGNVPVLDRYGGLLRLVARWSFSRADYVTCVSNTVAERVQQYYPCPNRMGIIPNGVDARIFQPLANRDEVRRELGLPEGFVFISASRLVEKNGIDTLVRAASELAGGSTPFTILIAGDGEMRPALEQLIAELGLDNVVRLVGTIPHAELPRWLAACDAFVRPSVSEGFGIAFVEAMACGLPLLTTPVVSQMNIFEEGVHGLVSPVGDAALLADRMIQLMNDEVVRTIMSTEARRWAVERYDWDSIVGQIESVYKQALKECS
jgi:glycosyltransferase involved in cell wall biosynthesis